MEHKNESAQEMPSDAIAIKKILASMGAEDYEPRVVNQLLDFLYRYVTDVLLDAELYAEHTGKASGEASMEDVMLAIQSRTAYSFVQPPTHATLAEVADQLNSIPLPDVTKRFGLPLPPDEDCLVAPNYQLKVTDGAPHS